MRIGREQKCSERKDSSLNSTNSDGEAERIMSEQVRNIGGANAQGVGGWVQEW